MRSLKKRGFLAIYFYIFSGIFVLSVVSRLIHYFKNPDAVLFSGKSILIICILVGSLAIFGYFGVWNGLKQRKQKLMFRKEFESDSIAIHKKYNRLTRTYKTEVVRNFDVKPCPVCDEDEIILLDLNENGDLINTECKLCGKEYKFESSGTDTGEVKRLYNEITAENKRIGDYTLKKYGPKVRMLDGYGPVLKLEVKE